MEHDLSPATVFLVTLAGSISGIMRDPLTIALCAALVLAGLATRAWWLPFAAAIARTGLVFYLNWQWWIEMGIDRDAGDFFRLGFIALVPFLLAFGCGRLLSRLVSRFRSAPR